MVTTVNRKNSEWGENLVRKFFNTRCVSANAFQGVQKTEKRAVEAFPFNETFAQPNKTYDRNNEMVTHEQLRILLGHSSSTHRAPFLGCG